MKNRTSPAQAIDPMDSIKLILVAYVLVTGDTLKALQGALFGVSGGAGAEFAVYACSSLLLDLVRLLPLFAFSRSGGGLLHPVTVTALIWPVLLQMPYFVELLFGNLSGLTGQMVRPNVYAALPAQGAGESWRAEAFYNLIQVLSLVSLYAGFRFFESRVGPSSNKPGSLYDLAGLRRLFVGLLLLVLVVMAVFLTLRGGVLEHLADLSRGRARALEGLGPVVAFFDLGTLTLMAWIALRPQDVKSPVFIVLLLAIAMVQFLGDGSRSSAFLVVVKVGLIWAIRTGRIPWRIAAVFAPVAMLAFGTLAIVRTAGLYGDTAVEALQRAEAAQVLTTIQDELEGRQYLAGSVATVAEGHHVMGGPMLGETYLGALFAFVPRPIWEDKPRGAGSIFAQNFLGADREGFAIPIGPEAEAYWNFGLPGVVVLFFLHGWVLVSVRAWRSSQPYDPFMMCFYAIVLTDFRMGTDNLVPFMQQSALLAAMFGLATLLGLRKSANADASTGLHKPVRGTSK